MAYAKAGRRAARNGRIGRLAVLKICYKKVLFELKSLKLKVRSLNGASLELRENVDDACETLKNHPAYKPRLLPDVVCRHVNPKNLDLLKTVFMDRERYGNQVDVFMKIDLPEMTSKLDTILRITEELRAELDEGFSEKLSGVPEQVRYILSAKPLLKLGKLLSIATKPVGYVVECVKEWDKIWTFYAQIFFETGRIVNSIITNEEHRAMIGTNNNPPEVDAIGNAMGLGTQ